MQRVIVGNPAHLEARAKAGWKKSEPLEMTDQNAQKLRADVVPIFNFFN